MDDLWNKKISALLHDPLIKALDIKKHEQITKKYREVFGLDENVKKEDIIASQMDRLPLPYTRNSTNQIRVSIDDLKGFNHPLSSNILDVYGEIKDKKDSLDREFISNLEKIKKDNNDRFSQFQALWWHLPDMIDYSAFLPADTRCPNHSIVDHLDTTSALAGTINDGNVDASLLTVTIGPVQGFISAARKTKDLWAGSYLLSLITYSAIEYIGMNYGFDSIIFPSMRNISFVRETFAEKNINIDSIPNVYPKPSQSVASLPNRFVALIPRIYEKEIKNKVEEVIKSKWNKIAEKYINGLNILDETYLKDQLQSFPEVYTTTLPLLDFDDSKAIIENLFIDAPIEKDVKYLNRLSERYDSYKPDLGSLYLYNYKLLIKKINAIKSIRAFNYFKDSSENGKILPGDQFTGDMKAIVNLKDGEKIDRVNIINAIKRKFSEKELEDSFESVDVPAKSNSKIYEKIFGKKLKNNYKNNYYSILVMDGDKMGHWISGKKSPDFKDILAKQGFLNEESSFVRNFDICNKIDDKELKNYILNRKTIQPSYHRTVSRTLNIFSSFVEPIVEKYKGRLIYAGGDDVLAFLPAVSVLKCANDIRKMYSGLGNIKVKDKNTKKEYIFKNEMVYLIENEKEIPLCTMMGEKATMSAGIAIINNKFPLSNALNIARQAEKIAKESLNRNSFNITIVKRSGQQIPLGMKWQNANLDVIEDLFEVMKKIEEKELSSRSLRKLIIDKDNDLSLTKDEFIDYYIGYVIDRSELNKEDKLEITKLLKDFYRKVYELNNQERDIGKNELLNIPTNLLLTLSFLMRGEGK